MKHIQVIYILLLAVDSLQAGALLHCICGTSDEETTVTRIKIEPAEPLKTECHSIPKSTPIEIPQADSSRYLVMPKPMRPHSSTTSSDTSLQSGTNGSYASTRRSHLATPAPTPLSPTLIRDCCAHLDLLTSSPSTPITPITPLSVGSPSSPESPISPVMKKPSTPIFEEGRIITYPEHILEEQRKARYQHATAFAKAFIKQLPRIREQYVRTKSRNIYDEFSYELEYEIPKDDFDKKEYLAITPDRLRTLQTLIPERPPLTEYQAEAIMHAISAKMGLERSLKQFMLTQATESAEKAFMNTEKGATTDLTQASAIIKTDPTFKPFHIPRDIDPQIVALAHIRSIKRHSY